MNEPTHHSSLSTWHSHRAFTLIELMVVIGIIGVLIAIAIPAFSRVRTQSKSTATQATISTLEVGLESFRGDSQIGGSYPPSYGFDTNDLGEKVASPHVPNPAAGSPTITLGGAPNPPCQPGVWGANFLAWAMVGADQLGSPGFKNLNGQPDSFAPASNSGNYGGWTDDTHNAPYDPVNPAASPLGLYSIDKTTNQPAVHRIGNFVELSRMNLPKFNRDTGYFEITKLDVKPPIALETICFLDSFNQPILYYKANANKPNMVDMNGGGATQGTYNQYDNVLFTGQKNGPPGVDFGAGPDPSTGQFHPMANLFFGKSSFKMNMPFSPTNVPEKGTFFERVWDPNISAKWQAQKNDSYILLSAGPDGRYGTGDDLANFTINP